MGLPAPSLITDPSLEDSQVGSLVTQGMAMMNVDVWLSSGSQHCSGTTVVVSLGCGVAVCLGKVFQRLSALGLHVACLVAVGALSLIVALCLLERFCLSVLAFALALDLTSLPLPFGFAPSCMGTSWQSMYCCVRVISTISSRICVQLVILTLFRMRCSLTCMSSISSIVTPNLMPSSTIFDD